ncbi:MAG TPA: sorbosone dehydrogenase family protein [Caulobacterales bacterium]|nr:sorbosone dehydrogenase family protein [Caulobacterales bacterium]
MRPFLFAAAFLALASCNPSSGQESRPDYGAHPNISAPNAGMLPTVNAARAVGWPQGAKPTAPPGMEVTAYMSGLEHPRWLYVLSNGDVLVALASTEAETGGGIVGWVRNNVQRDAGAIGAGPNAIALLRDANGDGVVDAHALYAQNLRQPFGMVLLGDWLYVADTDAVLRYRYAPGDMRAAAPPETVIQLPYRRGGNGHWTRNIVARPDGQKLYVSVGSSSNIADNGIEAERDRAAIWEINPDGSGKRIFASGLRNPNGMDFEPTTGALWTVVNERDMLGDTLPPDYLTSVRDGAFYGWPYSYWGAHVDTRVTPPRPDLVARAIAPDYALGAHTASLGLLFYRAALLPAHYRGGAFIGQHGSWNRSQRSGYKVVFVPFANGRPSGDVEDFLTGFLNARSQAQGRPVGVAVDRTGALLVADDVGGVIWRVAPAR